MKVLFRGYDKPTWIIARTLLGKRKRARLIRYIWVTLFVILMANLMIYFGAMTTDPILFNILFLCLSLIAMLWKVWALQTVEQSDNAAKIELALDSFDRTYLQMMLTALRQIDSGVAVTVPLDEDEIWLLKNRPEI